jgi:hypothetical protein
LAEVRARLISGKPLASTADGESLVVKQTANLTDDQHILTLVIASVASPFYRLKLRKFLFPIAQYVGLYPTQVAYLTNREVPLSRYWRKLVVIPGFQHMLPRALLVFVLGGMSLPDEP